MTTMTRGSKPSAAREYQPLLRTTSSIISDSSMEIRPAAASPAAGDWIRNAWIIHIIVGLVVVTIAMWNNNDESKYIPLKVTVSLLGGTCDRAFANVLSFGSDEEGALQCCTSSSSNIGRGPCALLFLPLEKRLANFPEAWVYPLMPWLYRLIWDLMEQCSVNQGPILARALKRFALYMCVMLFRGWVLYVGLNAIEAQLVSWELEPTDEELCWYKQYLRTPPSASPCYGRMFDYSDHVVFYFVQVLSIVWFEYLDMQHTLSSRKSLGFVFLTGMVAYLHIIVYVGVYKTARWFHTGGEIMLGWCLSLTVTVPLALWQSASASTSRARRSERSA
eukprot:scaffold1564_cov174-Amphora_coffeaeformis.AAC.16